ncbi:MAG: SDR family NAD(P)-dependent oxidoreductase [Atopobiaceae bacterium]|nr:SDR family NAD(P)-dependent oxidoreductase [Atopobiaceae bacterium]
MRQIAIVTGASSGVGKEFVTQLAAGAGGPLDEIWAIARTKDALDKLAASAKGVHVRPLSLDLTNAADLDKLAQELDSCEGHVQWLISCAGMGKFGSFESIGRDASATMIRLNCLALVEVCSLVLPHMQPGSRIINIASIAGIVPQPYLTVYSATKAFVYEFSRMLDEELRAGGIRVTAVCSKFMRTGFLDNPGDDATASSMCRIGFQDVATVVRRATVASLLGHPVCIPSLDMRAAAIAAKLLPRRALFAIEDLLFRR